MAWAKAYVRVKFHLDPPNRLATVHQRHRQTDRQRTDSIGRTVLQTVAQKTCDQPPNLMIDSSVVEHVDSVVYLGGIQLVGWLSFIGAFNTNWVRPRRQFMLLHDGHSRPDVSRRIGLASSVMSTLLYVVCHCHCQRQIGT